MSTISALSVEFIFGSNDITRCKVCQIGVISIITFNLNIFLVALLSLDRFLFVRFPLHYSKYVTVKSTVIIVIGVAVFCIAISVPPLFGFGEIRFTRPINTCVLYLIGETPVTRNLNYVYFILVVSILGPGTILVVTNTWLACIVYKQLKKQHQLGHVKRDESQNGKEEPANINGTKNKKKFPVGKLFGFLLTQSIIVWIPTFINIGILIVLDPKNETDDRLFSVPNEFFVSIFIAHTSNIFFSPLVQLFLVPDFNIFVKKNLRQRFTNTLSFS